MILDSHLSPIIFATILGNENNFENYISQPQMSKLNGHRVILFIITGIYYGFVVSSHLRNEEFLMSRLNMKNELIMSYIPPGKDIQHFLKVAGVI